MTGTAFRNKPLWALIASIAISFSCSTTSTAPRPGTPAFYWNAARETFTAGDYAKTVTNLDGIIATQNEYTAKAQPWLMVLTAGMASGYMDMADAFQTGARANRTDPLSFRRQVSIAQGAASRLALHFAEVFGRYQDTKGDYIPLAFPYPSGIAAPLVALTKVSNGVLPPDAEIDSIRRRSIERGVLLTTCEAVGAPGDPAKTQDIFKGESPRVARATFILAMANALYEQSLLYSQKKMDDPDKLKALCERAQNALKTIPESKQTKELSSKIERTLKREKIS